MKISLSSMDGTEGDPGGVVVATTTVTEETDAANSAASIWGGINNGIPGCLAVCGMNPGTEL